MRDGVMAPSAVALIPARQGSKRVPGKNVRVLNGHPMLAYAIASALDSGVFAKVPWSIILLFGGGFVNNGLIPVYLDWLKYILEKWGH